MSGTNSGANGRRRMGRDEASRRVVWLCQLRSESGRAEKSMEKKCWEGEEGAGAVTGDG